MLLTVCLMNTCSWCDVYWRSHWSFTALYMCFQWHPEDSGDCTVYEDVKNAHTFWHRDNVLSQRGCLLPLLYTMRDNIRWNGAMKEQKWIFCCDFCLKELWRWWACVHSLICSCISLWAFAESRALTGKNTRLHLHETHRIFIYFFYWDQWRLMNNLVSFPTSPPGSRWRSTSQKLPIISSWLH